MPSGVAPPLAAKLRQNLFIPPKVKSWDRGTAWINSATFIRRSSTAWLFAAVARPLLVPSRNQTQLIPRLCKGGAVRNTRQRRDVDQRDSRLRSVLPRLAHVHVFHWLPGDPIDRRALTEGVDLRCGWISTMKAAGPRPDALLEFIKGDSPGVLTEDAAVLREILAR